VLARYDVLHMPRIDLYFTAEADQRPVENEQSIRPRGWDVIDVTPLIVLLSVDAILVLLDALATHGRDNGSWLADPRLLLATQDSYGEWFGDLTLLLVVTLVVDAVPATQGTGVPRVVGGVHRHPAQRCLLLT